MCHVSPTPAATATVTDPPTANSPNIPSRLVPSFKERGHFHGNHLLLKNKMPHTGDTEFLDICG